MPSEYIRDPDKVFFEICRRAYPYFLHADSDFLNNFIPLMRAIDIAHNDMNKADLYELVQRATDLLDDWDEGHKGVMTDLIRRHYFRVTSFEERFAELYDLAKGKRGKKADKELSELKERVEQLSIEVSNLKTLMEKKKEVPLDIPEVVPEAIPEVVPEIVPEAVPLEVPKEVEQMNMRKKRSSRHEIEQKLELIKNYLKTNREIDNPKCREICNINTIQASHMLHKLVEENFVEKGKGPRPNYVIKE
ncbi:MAG: hypothetical protein PHH85_01680 [Candidatus Methanoperedens sp.]|nr:hypothetical protein [Candidatus Methanoperedens sp.]